MSEKTSRDLKSSPAVQFLVGLAVIIFMIIVALKSCSSGANKPATEISSVQAKQSDEPSGQPKPKVDTKEYSQKIKLLLRQDLKLVDVYIEDDGALKWMFVAVGYDEWLSMRVQDRKEMVTILLRGMRETFQDATGLKVSVWVNERQRLAEGSWSFLSERPEVELIGE